MDDVIVVGAGPTGLMTACELALAGVSCRVVERRDAEPGIVRAFALHARALELLDARGLGDRIVARGHALNSVRPAYAARVAFDGLDTRYPMMLVVPQNGTEHLLRERAERLGVAFTHGAAVRELRQDTESVRLGLSDGTWLRARYAVGADGAHSTVRDLLGTGFEGDSYAVPMLLADVQLDAARGEPPMSGVGPTGAVVSIPFGDGWYRVGAWLVDGPPDERPPDIEVVRDAFRRVCGTDYGMSEPRWISRFVSQRRQAASYRTGRVFLVGDAAHVTSPIGGQGMNTGLQDAVNLGWKLAAELHGWAPPWLLDSYHAERHPVGEDVLRLTDRLTRIVLSGSRVRQWVERRAMTALLASGPGRRRILGAITGVGVAYPARGVSGALSHPLAGRRAPDGPTDAGRLYEVLREGRFVLVTRDGRGPRGWDDRVRTVRAAGPMRPAAVLVRPDGYVAWAGGTPGTTADGEGIGAALMEWCGPPTAVADAESEADRPRRTRARKDRSHRAPTQHRAP